MTTTDGIKKSGQNNSIKIQRISLENDFPQHILYNQRTAPLFSNRKQRNRRKRKQEMPHKKNGERQKNPCRKISKKRFLKAMIGTGGIKTEIAKRLGCARSTVANKLLKPKWDDVREAYDDECDKVGDLAEQALQDAIEMRGTLGGDRVPAMSVAAKTSLAYLKMKHKNRGYGDESKVTIQGGKAPIKIEQKQSIGIEDLNLPLKVRKIILKAIEKKKEEMGEDND